MNVNVNYTSDELEKARKKAKRRERIREKTVKVQGWYYDHRQEILVLAPVVLAAIKFGGKQVKLSKEKHLKEDYCYDRSLGHYWALRRTPSNQEWLEIDRRKRNGERMADILSDMRLLK